MVMHAWLRNTVMRLRFIKPRSQVAAATKAKRPWGKSERRKGARPTPGPVERNDGGALSPLSFLRRFFRQDNSSFCFLCARRVKLKDFEPIRVSRRLTGEGNARARNAPGPTQRNDDDSYAERDPPRWSEARERLSVYRNPDRNLRRARLEELSVSPREEGKGGRSGDISARLYLKHLDRCAVALASDIRGKL